MDTLQKVVLAVHTLNAILIIVLVLLQRGKGADAGAAFGAGASGTVFGARGSSSFFSRLTAIFATAFFVSSLTLAYLSSQHLGARPGSLLDEAVREEAVGEEAVGDDAAGENAAGALPTEDEPPGADELPSIEDVTDTGDAGSDDAPPEATDELPSGE